MLMCTSTTLLVSQEDSDSDRILHGSTGEGVKGGRENLMLKLNQHLFILTF